MFNDLIVTSKEWKPDAEALKILEDLKWEATLAFTLYLDTPNHEEHYEKEALQYILLILAVMKDIETGERSDDMDYMWKLEAQLEQWEYFYNSFSEDYEYEEDEEIEEKPCGNPLMKEVDEIMIQASLRDEAEDGE
jgi:hypothetical protein